MATKKKPETTENDWSTGWRCDDCQAWNSSKIKNCMAPQHEWALRANELQTKLYWAERPLKHNYMTPQDFTVLVARMHKEFLEKQYDADKAVPQLDLITASMSFFETMWILITNGFEADN